MHKQCVRPNHVFALCCNKWEYQLLILELKRFILRDAKGIFFRDTRALEDRGLSDRYLTGLDGCRCIPPSVLHVFDKCCEQQATLVPLDLVLQGKWLNEYSSILNRKRFAFHGRNYSLGDFFATAVCRNAMRIKSTVESLCVILLAPVGETLPHKMFENIKTI